MEKRHEWFVVKFHGDSGVAQVFVHDLVILNIFINDFDEYAYYNLEMITKLSAPASMSEERRKL